MSEKIVVPALGESITEATVSKWLKIEGDKVDADEPIVELETDKVNLEVPSPITGILTEIISKDGAIVEVGANLGIIKEVKDSSQKEEKINKIKPTVQKNEVTNLETSKEKEPELLTNELTEDLEEQERPLILTEEVKNESDSKQTSTKQVLSPAVRKIVEENSIWIVEASSLEEARSIATKHFSNISGFNIKNIRKVWSY